MKILKEHLLSYAKAELNTFNLTLIEDKALSFLQDEILEEFKELNMEEVKSARHEHFSVSGASVDSYCERELDLGSSKRVIYGVRHLAGDRERPFISLKPNFTIENKHEALSIYHQIKDELDVFNPLFLSFWSRDKINVDFFGSIYMVARAEEIKNNQGWASESNLNLVDVECDSYYEWYESQYSQFLKTQSELSKWVKPNSLETLEDSRKEGLLKYIKIEDELVGLIAAEKSSLLGHSGFYFNEIFMCEKWQGKGLAKSAQRKFVTEICSDDEFVWGTIYSENLPSYRTALANIRRPVRYECFINL